MALVKNFEDLLVWQKSRVLVKEIYLLTRQEKFSKDFGLRDQIQRAAVSVPSNISEGFDRQSRKEFKQFLYIARGSASEVRTQLYLAFDLGYIAESDLKKLKELTVEISKMLGGLITQIK